MAVFQAHGGRRRQVRRRGGQGVHQSGVTARNDAGPKSTAGGVVAELGRLVPRLVSSTTPRPLEVTEAVSYPVARCTAGPEVRREVAPPPPCPGPRSATTSTAPCARDRPRRGAPGPLGEVRGGGSAVIGARPRGLALPRLRGQRGRVRRRRGQGGHRRSNLRQAVRHLFDAPAPVASPFPGERPARRSPRAGSRHEGLAGATSRRALLDIHEL